MFLSHCVRTMGSAAMKLNEMLREKDFTTFICVSLEPGDAFRDRDQVQVKCLQKLKKSFDD